MKLLSVACACVIVAASATAQNLLTNGSFNGDVGGWTTGYSTYDPTLDATGTGGSGSAKALIPALSGVNALSQCVAIDGATTYKAGGKLFVPPGQATTGIAYFFIEFYSGTDCATGYLLPWSSPYLKSTTTWATKDTGFVIPPSLARSASVGGGASNDGGAGAPDFQVNFDDMFLTAGGSSYQRWIPAASHKDVPSKNARWRSDIAILNRTVQMANLMVTMYPPAGPVTKHYVVYGASQILLTDVAGWLGVTADSGPLEVISDQEFFLSGRTYNQVDATHTYGQNYEGDEPSDLLAAGDSSTSTAWLPQLTENALYRANIGITNAGTETANVTVTLYDAYGNQVWADSRDYAAGGFYQYQQPYLALGGIASGYAKVTVNSGSGVVAYASVVDANTGDPTTITMKR